MRIGYSLAQFIGCLLILSLLGMVLIIDRIIIFYSQNYAIGNDNMLFLMIFVVLFAIAWKVTSSIKGKKSDNSDNGKRKNRSSWREKIVMLVTSSCSGNWVDICFILAFFLYVAWLPDTCSDFVKDGLPPYRFLLYILGLLLMIYVKPTIMPEKGKVNNEYRTLLVTGISHIRNVGYASIEPLINPLGVYKNIQKMIVLLPKQISLNNEMLLAEREKGKLRIAYRRYKYEMFRLYVQYSEKAVLKEKDIALKKKVDSILSKIENVNYEDECELFGVIEADFKDSLSFDLSTAKEDLVGGIKENMRHLIKDGVEAYCEHMDESKRIGYDFKNLSEIEFTSPVDYNVFQECNDECYDRLSSIMRKGFLDKNVIVNITCGTSLVASALTLNAIKGERTMIYTDQGSKKIVQADPNVWMYLFNDLVAERLKSNE